MAVFQKENEVAQLFERVFVLHDLSRKRIELEQRNALLDVGVRPGLLEQQRFDFAAVLLDLHFELFAEFLQVARVDVLENQPQIQLRVGRRAELFRMDFVQRVDNAVVEAEHERRVRAARLFRVDDHQSGQQREPFRARVMVDARVLDLDDENRGCIGRHLFVQHFGRGAFQHDDGVLVEHVALEQLDSLVGIARDDGSDHAVHALEIDGPLAAVQKVADLGLGRVVRTLADHLLERVHQVVPVRLVDVARHADHVAVLAQVAHMAA